MAKDCIVIYDKWISALKINRKRERKKDAYNPPFLINANETKYAAPFGRYYK